jgi:hypothetical protein
MIKGVYAISKKSQLIELNDGRAENIGDNCVLKENNKMLRIEKIPLISSTNSTKLSSQIKLDSTATITHFPCQLKIDAN